MIAFVYENDEWLESKEISPDDIVLFYGIKESKIYLWFGPLSNKELKEAAEKRAKDYLKEKHVQGFEVLTDNTISLKLQSKIEELLGKNRDYVSKKIQRTLPMSIFYYVMYVSLLLILASVLNFLRLFQNEVVENGLKVNVDLLQDYFNLSEIFIIISIVLSCIGIVCAIWSDKMFLIISSVICSVISLGFYFYIDNREFLFYSMPTPSEYDYYFEIGTVIIFLVWCFIALIGHGISTIISNRAIRKTTSIEKKEIVRHDMGILNEQEDIDMQENVSSAS